MPTKLDKLLIIDGNALIHRSFHALPPTMRTKDGKMTNAVYGFTTVLLKALKEFLPKYVALTLDKKGPTFRHKKFKEYKAKRIKAPDELYDQIPLVKEIAQGFNIPIYELEGFEADDLIGTIAQKAGNDIEKIIVTGDMDTLQLVNPHTKVYTMSRGLTDSILYDEKTVHSRFGLAPNQMIDYKALRGDPSDNIPGVKGVGEKTATELLNNFKTLDGVYNNLSSKKIKERTKELLEIYKDDAYLSKELATIDKDVDLNFNLENTVFGNFNQNNIIKVLSDLEFKSLLPRIYNLLKNETSSNMTEGGEADKFKRNQKLFDYNLIDNEDDFKKFLVKLEKQKSFAFDTETTSLDLMNCDLLGISFSWKGNEAYYINFKTQNSLLFGGRAKLKTEERNLFNFNKKEIVSKAVHPWLLKIKPILENTKIKKFGHNIKFDLRAVKNFGIDVEGIDFDTMIASYLLNPGTRQHNLDAVTFAEFGHQKISKEDLLGSGRNKIGFKDVETPKLSIYSCEDADFTFKLVSKLKKELEKQKLLKLFEEIEIPLVKVLAEMEENGILLDVGYLQKMEKEVNKKIEILSQKIYTLAECRFNINSTQQLKEVLFNKLQIPTINISKTKTGLSTATEELFKLRNLHPIISLIQEYRELNKLLNTYVAALPNLINEKDNKLHTSFNQTITATGRLSSVEPNLQNIPIKTELGRKVRKAFVAGKGNVLLSFDYSQIELRLAAHMSGDKKMIEAFKKNADIHKETAAKINHVKIDEVTPQMRREAKAINFGIIYGQGAHGLSQTADIPYARAKEFIDKYFGIYKEMKNYINKSINTARQKGYAQTLIGRRRYLPEINSGVLPVRKAAERMAINMPIQGTGADMIKAAMIKIDEEIKNKDDIKMILQVHDELIFEVKKESVAKYKNLIRGLMENIIKLKAPIKVDVGCGNNWEEIEELK